MTFSELTDRPHGDARRGDVVVCVCGPAEEGFLATVRRSAEASHAIFIAGGEGADVAVDDVEAVMQASSPADVILVRSGPSPDPDAGARFERLRAAAAGDPSVGLVSAGDDWILLRRPALELVGPLDSSLGLEQAIAEFGERCLGHGLRRLAAADPPDEGADRPLSVTIDGRGLSVSVTGTAVATQDLIEGLTTHTGLRVRVLVGDESAAETRDTLTGMGAQLLRESDAAAAQPTDIVHRPHQVSSPEDLTLLRRLGRRLLVTQLDSIAYRMPSYFDSAEAWRRYRELTEAVLASVDQVIFISPHGEADAHALGLVEERRSAVIPLAVEAPSGDAVDDPDDAAQPLPDRPYLLCLGTDFAHKNRPFALRLLEALVTHEDFDGELVFAGPHVATGSSSQEEGAYLAARPLLATRVTDRGAVGEAQKRRLIAHAAAVVYPTTFEGFGLIPFEAARLGVPTLFAWVTSLRDLFAEDLALLVAWDGEASARAAVPVLTAGDPRDRQIAGVLAAGANLTSAESARRHAELYERVLSRPEAGAGRVGRRSAEMMTELDRAQVDFRNVHRELDAIYRDPIAGGFVGPHAIVPEELQRLALAVATRPALRDRVVGLYRIARRLGGGTSR